ncbi:hypothetical protein ACFQZJ_09835 [Maribacter chungangensis]|uniref:T9SS C-terminal target domain-containing protein n=1 Tax=Maribacter chungangensis TaxID=1069117 RepID=A0ABW3B361_9FLAO
MKYFILVFVLLIGISFSCSTDTITTEENIDTVSEEDPIDDIETPPSEETQVSNDTNVTSLTTYIFGHSLIVHDPPSIATPSNETTVPHWMASFANASNTNFKVAGQYGFLTQHDNLPPISQWGFDSAKPAWDSDNESFAAAGFNTILLTAGNFIQYQAATENYYNEPISPVGSTLRIFDWVNEQAPEATFYVYENWPDMAPFIENEAFPPTGEELNNYHEHTLDAFHNWWLDYHDSLLSERPNSSIKMIPVGPIISKLLTETPLQEIPILELYEDNAPHGRPTVYFVAGLISYMAMYNTKVTEEYNVPNTVHAAVRDNFSLVVDYIWDELNSFNFENGESRVLLHVE